VHQVIWKKKPGKLSTIILLQNNACPHTADLVKVTLATVGWEIMNHLPYSRELVPSDQSFQTNDELKCGVLNWLCNQDKTFYAAASVTCQDDRKKVLV
jgi:hypothetical protein